MALVQVRFVSLFHRGSSIVNVKPRLQPPSPPATPQDAYPAQPQSRPKVPRHGHRPWRRHGWIVLGLALVLGLGWAASPGLGQPAPAPLQNDLAQPTTNLPQSLRVAIRLMQPDAFEENGQILGFSADIGRAIVAQMAGNQPPPAVNLQTYTGVTDILTALQTGQADLGLGAIAITSQREQAFDFSHPILSAGLQIMVPAPAAQRLYPLREIINRLLQPDLVKLSAIVGLMMLIPAHIIWYVERNNPESVIEKASYFPGIFHALWWTLLALFGQADDMPEGPVGKLVALFWVFVGIIYLTYFTAGLTAELTVQELQGNIQGLSDLQNRPVALVADEGGQAYLEAQNLKELTQFSQPEAAYAALAAGEVEALVAPRPLLLYLKLQESNTDYQADYQIVGTPFFDQFYAIAMPEGSPYRNPINQALLALRENGTYTKIYRQWFGVDP